MSKRASAGGRTGLSATCSTALPRLSPLTASFSFVAVALLVFAVLNIEQSARFADVFLVAERLEQSGKVSAETLEKTANKADLIVRGGYCRSDIVMAGTTLVLNRLDIRNEITDYGAWAKAAEEAEEYMRHAVSCMPTESNLWLRLAAVRAVIVQEPRAIARLMTMSSTLAPADENALIARLYFWNHLNGTTLKNAQTSVERDLRVLMKFGNTQKIGVALRAISAALVPYLKEAGTRLTPERKASLTWFGLNLDELP